MVAPAVGATERVNVGHILLVAVMESPAVGAMRGLVAST